MEFVIEKNIPISGKAFVREGIQKKIAAMVPGDSVRVDPRRVNYVRTCCRRLGLEGKYSVRKQEDGSYRMWRLCPPPPARSRGTPRR